MDFFASAALIRIRLSYLEDGGRGVERVRGGGGKVREGGRWKEEK